ncbi:MAG: hypothetical protein ACREJQ_05975, partial [bacterium]
MWRLWANLLLVPERPFAAFGRLSLKQALESFQLVSISSEHLGRSAMFLASNFVFFIFGLALTFTMISMPLYVNNPFLIFAFTYSFLFIFLLLLLVMNFSTWTSSPTDLEVLLFRPIDSRSHMAVKTLVMLYFLESWALAYSLPLALRYLWAGAAAYALLLLLGAGLMTLLVGGGVMAAYMALVKWFGMHRLQPALNSLQIVAAILIGVLVILQRQFVLHGAYLASNWV